MRKIAIFLITLLAACSGKGQLQVNFQLPPVGLSYKSQLWTMALTNTSPAPITLHIEMTLASLDNAQQVLSGSTKTFSVQPGTTLVNASMLTPVQYNTLSSTYVIDPGPDGLLPVGAFTACYHFFKHESDNIQEITEQCQDVFIDPLAPPQLIYPFDQTSIEETNPLFRWLPPVPINLYSNLTYDFVLVPIYSGQSAADALQQNIPLYQQANINATNLMYPPSATALVLDQPYAWRITAKNNEEAVGASENWQFSLKQYATFKADVPTDQPFVKLKREVEGYAVCFGDVKFNYVNETSDSVWNARVYDLSQGAAEPLTLPLDSVPLKPGQNLVRYAADNNAYFIDHHFYLLEVLNSRSEIWRLRFEYRKPNDNY